MTRDLRATLTLVPAVYARLGDALTPGRGAGDGPSTPDPVHRPAPARLDAVEHRHQLLRGLRWWVASTSPSGVPEGVGVSPARMCAVLLARLPHLSPSHRVELHANLTVWLDDAYHLTGAVAAPRPRLPLEALTQTVPVHVAADVLGVSVSTVQRRTPGRVGGMVVLRDAAGPLCRHTDLPEPWCAHCRPDSVNRVRAELA